MSFFYTATGRALPWLAGFGLWLPLAAQALTLDQALQLAEQQAPSLAAQAANQTAARQAAIPAGELPDPKLSFGIQNLPIEERDRWSTTRDSMTMKMVGFEQEMPNADKRRARVEGAQAAIEVADARQQIERLRVQRETALAWISLLATEQKLALFPKLYEENRLLSQAIKARIAGGRGAAADSVQPKQEAALLGDQEDELHQQQRARRAALRQWIGVAADQRVSGNWPSWPKDAQHYQHNLLNHPELQAFEPQTRQAQAEVQEAVADKKPDWGWGVDYQKRGSDYSDMVSVKVSMSLPLFGETRQNPRIAARQAKVAELEAEREAQVRQHARELEEDLAELQRLDRTQGRLADTLLPLAEERVKLALADYRGGRGELTAVVEARRALIETRLRQIDLLEQQASARARLHFAYGAAP